MSTPTSPSPGPDYYWNSQTNQWEKRPTGDNGLGVGYGPNGAPGSGFATPQQAQDATNGALFSQAGPTGQTAEQHWADPANGGAPGAPPPPPPLPRGIDPKTGQPYPAGSPFADIAAGKTPFTVDYGANGVPGSGVLTPAEQDAAAAEKLRASLEAQRIQKERQAPQVAPPTPVGGVQVAAPAPVAAVTPTAATVAPTTAIGAPTIGPAVTYDASKVAATPLATAVQAKAAQLNLTPQEQFRQQQNQIAAATVARALGTSGPSAAEIQAQKQFQDAQAQQLGLVSMNHGRGQGGALRQAGQNIAKLESDAALANALLRAKETETATGQAISATGEARGQDIGLTSTQAGFEQGANLQNAQLGTAVEQSNAQIAATRAMKQADLEQAAAAGNALAQNELIRRKAELDVEVAKANQGTTLQTNLATAANQQQSNVVGATEQNKVAMSNQDAQLKANLAQAGFDQQALIFSSEQDLKAKLANAGFTLTQEQLDQQRQQAANELALQATSNLLNYRTGVAQQDAQRAALAAQIEQARKSGNIQLLGTLLTVAGTLGVATIGGGGSGGGSQTAEGRYADSSAAPGSGVGGNGGGGVPGNYYTGPDPTGSSGVAVA